MKNLAVKAELNPEPHTLVHNKDGSARLFQETLPVSVQWPTGANQSIAQDVNSSLLNGLSDLRLVNSELSLETIKSLGPRAGFANVTFVMRVGSGANVSDGVPLDALNLFSGAEAVRRLVGAERLIGIVILEGAPEQRASMPLELSAQRSRAAFGYLSLAQALRQSGMPVDLFLDTDLMGNEYDQAKERLSTFGNSIPESALHEAAIIETASGRTDSRLFVGWASEDSLSEFNQIQQIGPVAARSHWISGGILQTRNALERAGLLSDKGFICIKPGLSVNPHNPIVRPDVINQGDCSNRLRLDQSNGAAVMDAANSSTLGRKAALKALSRYLELALSLDAQLPNLGLVSESELSHLRGCSATRVKSFASYKEDPSTTNTELLRRAITAQEEAMKQLVLSFQGRVLSYFGRSFTNVGFTPERAQIKNDTFDPDRMTSSFERKPTYVPRARGKTLETSLGLDGRGTRNLTPYRDRLKVENAHDVLTSSSEEDNLALVS